MHLLPPMRTKVEDSRSSGIPLADSRPSGSGVPGRNNEAKNLRVFKSNGWM